MQDMELEDTGSRTANLVETDTLAILGCGE